MEKISPTLTLERILAPGALDGLGAALARHGLSKKLRVICDDATWDAAGMQLTNILGPDYTIIRHSLGLHVRPHVQHGRDVANACMEGETLIALGSGTLNDITKYAAYARNKPYFCVATAASMNGYVSANASLEEHNAKHSHAARPPMLLIADLSIIAAAPKRLSRAGLGDTLCRTTVEADMLLSHHLLGTDYPREAFDRMRAHEPALLAHTLKLRDHNPEFYHCLMTALIEAGDIMTEYGSSAPASQGEHMLAHTAEMLYGSELHGVLHGELIAVTTLSMSRLQQKMLLSVPNVRTLARDITYFERAFGREASSHLHQQYAKKLLTPDQVATINTKLTLEWLEIKDSLAAVMVASNSIERAFIHSHTPTTPADLNLMMERYNTICQYAYLSRDRFTFLDLAEMNNKRF